MTLKSNFAFKIYRQCTDTITVITPCTMQKVGMYVYLYYLPLESTYNFGSISQHINKRYTVRYNKF